MAKAIEVLSLHPLQCMEIWGGNQAIEQAVATPGLDLWVYSRPYNGESGGGDVHYVSLCGGGKITRFILADIAGHGASVTDLAISLRALMRKNINREDQSRLIETLNREFSELAKLGRFATAVVATYITKGDRLTICNAGHPRPLYRKAMTGEWVYLSSEDKDSEGLVDLPLGILEETGYTQFEIALGKSDMILIYTDALIEVEGNSGQQLGQDGLLELVSKIDPASPNTFAASLVSAFDMYREGRPAGDDLTFILLHHNAGSARPPNLRETIGVYAKVLGLKSV